jgi:hypothetical protein
LFQNIQEPNVFAMQRGHHTVSSGGTIVLALLLLNAIVLKQGYVSGAGWYKLAWITVPLLLYSIVLFRQKRL